MVHAAQQVVAPTMPAPAISPACVKVENDTQDGLISSSMARTDPAAIEEAGEIGWIEIGSAGVHEVAGRGDPYAGAPGERAAAQDRPPVTG